MKTNSMHYLSSVYFVNQPLRVSGIFVDHHQEVYCICTTICTYRAFQLAVVTRLLNIYIYIYIRTHSIPPDDGPQICPKHIEVDGRNKLRINSASGWFL